MKEKLIGRQKEINDLQEWINSDKSEFIAIYGRRRVGKTFLVKMAVKDRFVFHFSGSYGLSRKEQLLNFTLSLRTQFKKANVPMLQNWVEAFHWLSVCAEGSSLKKKVIFLDELPWLDTPKSGFIPALEFFWNNWAFWRNDVKLIVCGSATSWIINKLIKDRGGLHNRLTHRILLMPFNLRECREYFKQYNFGFGEFQVAECYMTMGGIPYYFSLMNPKESLAQNINRLFFSPDAPLKDEFDELYRALFKNYESCIKIIRVLGMKGKGLTRQEILDITKLNNNGEFSKMLEDLEVCGFIRSYLPFEVKESRRRTSERIPKETIFQLIDLYTLFYLRFHKHMKLQDEKFWESNVNTPLLNTWRGLSFEMLALWHIPEIKRALGIADVSAKICSWVGEYNGDKAQIDLLIDRNDGTINLCEMKFSFREFNIDKSYARTLEEKREIFQSATGTHKGILLTLITCKGLQSNSYSGIVNREVTLPELF